MVASKPSALAQAIYRREIIPWTLLGLTLGLVESATAAILVKHQFAGVASPLAVNIAVGLASGASALSNVVSFIWANLAHGRERVPIMVALQVIFSLLVGVVALAPTSAGGLVMTVLAIMAARALWAGILTIRSAIWGANYPRNVLATMTGRIVVISSLTIALSAMGVGWAMQSGALDARWLYASATMAGLIGAYTYRQTRVRREFRMLAEEGAAGRGSEAFSLRIVTNILKEDPSFRQYMFWLGLFGGGNLMLIAQLVVICSEQLHLSSGIQILMLSVVPLVTLPFFTPTWARLFDGSHTVVYRSRQGWTLVAAAVVLCAGAFIGWLPLMWMGAIILGAANAGANLGWNLGHNDFASLGRAQHYMGVHVTLTGVRGAIAPPVGILVYEGLEAWQSGWGRFSLILPVAMTTAGTLGFNLMRKALEK